MSAPIAHESCPEIHSDTAGLPCPICDSDQSGESLTVLDFDCRAFRNALGTFATGITVVTALAPHGEWIGLTVSSFNSVSLDPPLILWSLARTSPNLSAFEAASHYSVSVLSANQQAISDRFSARGGDRFDGIPVRIGMRGVPLVEGCCAWFECANEARYPGGDHVIFVGRVEHFGKGEVPSPLVFHDGRYCKLQSD
jgi:flavin reductase (DIM6/NTAB) family NADH-FMN oxidoreductase RutF